MVVVVHWKDLAGTDCLSCDAERMLFEQHFKIIPSTCDRTGGLSGDVKYTPKQEMEIQPLGIRRHWPIRGLKKQSENGTLTEITLTTTTTLLAGAICMN